MRQSQPSRTVLPFLSRSSRSMPPSSSPFPLANASIVMVGDSLMRYQYLSLAFYLRHRQFPHPDARPHLLLEKSWADWHTFMHGGTKLLAPNELCDCYRDDAYNFDALYENRYYRDGDRNTSVSFFSYVGDWFSMKGRWRPDDEEHNDTRREPPLFYDPPRWEYKRLDAFLSSFLPALRPEPSVIVLNSGLWHDTLDDQHHALAVARAALAVADAVVWKTTNCRLSQVLPGATRSRAFLPTDVFMCSIPSVTCFNLSWTFDELTHDDYWDEGHFMPHVYTRINTQFLALLAALAGAATTRPRRPRMVDEDAGLVGKLVEVVGAPHVAYVADPSGFLLALDGGRANACAQAFATAGRVVLSSDDVLRYALGPAVGRICEEGSLLMASSGASKSVYLMENHTRREFQSFDAFLRRGLDMAHVARVPDRLLHKIRPGPGLF